MAMISTIIDWIAAQPSNLQPAYVAAAVQGCVLAFGLMTLLVTIWGNAWANRRNTLKASRDQQKLEIYKSVLKDIDAAADAQGKAETYSRTTITMLQVQADMFARGQSWAPVRERVLTLHNLHFDHLAKAGVLHRFIEQWQVVDARLDAFAKAFGYQNQSTMKAGMDLMDALRPLLPVDNPEGGIFPYRAPNHQQLQRAVELALRYQDESGKLGNYISDFNVELQPLLLGHLFGRRIVRRDAPDPAQFTIRLDRHRELIRHFEGTEFFQRGAKLERELREKHGTQRRWWSRFRR